MTLCGAALRAACEGRLRSRSGRCHADDGMCHKGRQAHYEYLKREKQHQPQGFRQGKSSDVQRCPHRIKHHYRKKSRCSTDANCGYRAAAHPLLMRRRYTKGCQQGRKRYDQQKNLARGLQIARDTPEVGLQPAKYDNADPLEGVHRDGKYRSVAREEQRECHCLP
jgi:hypothetical protein